MENTIQYECIRESHFDQLITLFQEFALFEKLPDRMTNTVEQMKREKDFFHGFVAKDANDTVVGYVTFFFAYYTWSGKALYMDDLYVSPDKRGRKIGTELINRVILHAKKENCHKLRWQVSEWNEPAIEFYKSLGAEIDHVEMNCDLLL